MSDAPVTSSAAPASESAPAAAPSPRAEPKKIAVGGTGGFLSLDSFNREVGGDSEGDIDIVESEMFDEESEADREEEASSDLEGADEAETTDEPERSEAEVDEKGFLKTLPPVKPGEAVFMTTADGKKLALPEDLKLTIKVDGQEQEVTLKEFRNIAAGEETVNQRLGKISSAWETVKKRETAIKERESEWQSSQSTVLNYIEEGKPEKAFVFLAERTGKSPVDMYQTFVSNIVASYKRFEGKTPEQIDAYFERANANWWKQKAEAAGKKQTEIEGEDARVTEYETKVSGELEARGLEWDHFTRAVAAINQTSAWKSTTPEGRLDEAFALAEKVKLDEKVYSVVDRVNPKLRENEALVHALDRFVQPDWEEAEIEYLVREYISAEEKKISGSLSRKVERQGAAPSEKKSPGSQQKRVFRSGADMASFFIGKR